MTQSDSAWIGSMPDIYDRYLVGPVFRPHAVDLARRAAATAPIRVLELAAGSGALTRELLAVLPDAEVTATDLNPDMVDHAASRIDGPHWQQADAMSLPFPDGAFDLVVCQFGVMFLPDKQVAFGEAARVLTPGGRLLFNTWDVLERNLFATIVQSALDVLCADDPPRFLSRIPYGYHDPDRVQRDVRAAGFGIESCQTVAYVGQAPSVAALCTGFCQGSPLRAEILRHGDVADITARATEILVERHGTGALTGPLTAHVVTARR